MHDSPTLAATLARSPLTLGIRHGMALHHAPV
jgi:hypothetical protein